MNNIIKKHLGIILLIVLNVLLYNYKSVNAQTVLFTDDFETDQGWTLNGEFERGTPGGLGGNYGNPDPTSAFSGSYVLGVDLTGSGTYSGDYEVNLLDEMYTAVSPSFSCVGYDYIELNFQRWLNVEQDTYDNAYIEVSNNGGLNWNIVWENDATTITDNAWNLNTIDISTYAANQSDVRIRFHIGETDGSWQYSGWNVDDIEVTGQTYIWKEDFSSYANGTNTGNGDPAIALWTSDGVDGSNRGITVNANRLRGRNTETPGYTTWAIDAGNPIEINGYTNVSISVDLSENSTLEATDYIQVQYNVDGAGWNNFDNNGITYDDFTSVTASQTGLSGNSLLIRIVMINDFNNERYFADNIIVTGTVEVAAPGDNYYSYQSGNWSDVSTWTHDPGGTTHTATDIPGSNDNVIILENRTVTLTADVDTADLHITLRESAILDQSTFQFTAGLSELNGTGTFKLASVNFPAVTTNDFVNADGGTTEYNNASNFTLPATQSIYNNLTINSSGVIATQLSDLTLNGNLYVKGGTYRINDNSSTTRLILTINGDVTVDNGASLTIGTGNTDSGDISGGTAPFTDYYDLNSHRIVVNGDFINNGTVSLTNQSYPVYDAFPNNGMATVYFMGATNNDLTCNNTTDFYNIVLDKGVDQTYKLTVYSSAYNNFRLFGRNSEGGENGGDNPDLRKALWIRTGTLELTGLTIIPSLSEADDGVSSPNGDFCIPVNGALDLNGTEVIVLSTADDYQEVNLAYGVSASSNADMGIRTSGGTQSISLYGKLQVDNGYFSTRESGGIITWSNASGQLEINGGIVDAKQFRTAGGGGGLGSYHQSGGSLLLRGRFQRTPTAYSNISNLKDFSTATLNTARATGGLDGDYATFNLNESENVFDMTGGTITIYDVCGVGVGQSGAFEVFSDDANNNVTGGTIEIIPITGTVEADATEFIIESTADLGNLAINRTGSTATVDLNTYDLTVINDLTITSGDLETNSLNVTVGGDFSIENGTTYSPGTNWTTFNGSGNQIFTINTGATLALKKLKIDKSLGDTLILAGSQAIISVQDSLVLVDGNLDDGGKTLRFTTSGTTTTSYLYNSGVHSGTGKIELADDDPQLITGDGTGIFENLELNNTDVLDAPVSLGEDITVNGTLTLSQDKLFDIATYNLALGASATIANASSNRYIETAGNAGDGGITKTYSVSATSFTFPLGAPSTSHATADYTPATISFGTAPTVYGSITVVPVGYEHPNTTNKNRSLTYFWRVKSSGFTMGSATVNHAYTYSENDVVTGGDITEAGYVAAMYDNSSYIWTKETSADVDETNNIIGGTGTAYETLAYIDGEFTAGDDDATDPFGAPTVYYSRQTGLWSNTNTWSLTDHSGASAGSVPGASDIVIIGGQDSVYLSTNNTIADTDVRNCATLRIEAGSALDIGYNPGCNFAVVLNHPNGNGNFRLTTSYNSGSTYAFPSGDFSDFNINLGTTELYTTNATAGTTYWLPNDINSYGNLIITPIGGSNIIFGNTDLLIYGNLITRGQDSRSWFCPNWRTQNYPTTPNTPVAKTITINGDFDLQGGALVWYNRNNTGAQDFVIGGDLILDTDAGIQVYTNGTANSQSISIGGSLINNSLAPGGGVNAYRGGDFTDIPLNFFGNGTEYITNDNPAANTYTVIESIIADIGSSQSDSLIVNITGTFTTPTDNWLTLENGTFHYEHDDDLTITEGSTFTIPSTAGLSINSTGNTIYLANDNVDDNDVYLNGKLTIIDGDVYVGQTGAPNNNNDIEYSGGGNSEIDLQNGSLTVNGQIRRNPATSAGILKYNQTGGNVTINGRNTLTDNAKFEILNDDSEFNMSAGTITIVRGGGGSTYGDLYLRPYISSVTGGEIIFNPGGAGDQDYIFDATVSIWDLTINGSGGNAANVELLVSSLQVDGDFTLVTATSTLDANSSLDIDITFNGNFDNSGTYAHQNNLTIFNGGAQSILGTSDITFYDLDVNPVTSLTLNKNATIKNELLLSSGTLVCGDYYVNAKGDVTNNATYTDNSTGLVLNGTDLQYVDGTGTWGQLELNNSSGARLLNDITLQQDFLLTSGIFDINTQLFTLGVNSDIVGDSYSDTKMITSDGAFSNIGVRKYYDTYSGAAHTDTIPLGTTGKYTPAYLTYTDNTNVGYIRINNINDHHPGVLDANNVLDYYWEVESSGIDGFNGQVVLTYLDSDVKVTGANTEADYIATVLLTPGTSWAKAAPGAGTDNVDETNNTITFDFSGASSLSGEYTAGIDAALPDEVPEYTSINDGDWTDPANWLQTGGDTYTLTGGPNGFVVTIASDDTVTLDANYASAYQMVINGKLKVTSSTYGHNLGTVSGSGILYLESGTFPAGRYSDFLDCSSSSTLEYGGTTDYTIIADLYTSIPKLHFSGTGTRTLPNEDLIICEQLLINGPTLDNSVNNRQLTIQGTMERYGSGLFNSGTGSGATVVFAGSSAQTLAGALGDFNGTSAFNNLEINNINGLTINNSGSIEVEGDLLLTDGIITTSATNTLTITNTDMDCVTPTGGSSSSYIDGPLTKTINQGDGFSFPVGKGSNVGNKINLSSTQTGTQNWTVEYFNPNSTAGSMTSPLTYVNNDDYWTITSNAGNEAYVNLDWDASSDITPLITENGLTDMRVAEYNTVSSEWEELTSLATGNDNNGTVSTTTRIAIPAGGSSDYTTACVNVVKPRAQFTPSGEICGIASGIPVTFTYSGPIPFDYTLDYTIDDVPQTQLSITSGEVSGGIYTLATTTTGTYKLTGFTYDNGAENGVVDPTEVEVYEEPTTANAGTDQSICGGTSATLTGNTPVTGSGLWTIISGVGGTVVTPTDPGSNFNGTNGTTYEIEWAITNGACVSRDTVIISFPLLPVQPGDFTAYDAEVCQGQTSVVYTVPNDASVTYTWSYSGTGATINGTGNSVTVDYNATATGGTLGVYATNGCGDSSPREIVITVNDLPTATLTVNALLDTICTGNNIEISIDFTAGTAPFDFTVGREDEVSTIVTDDLTNISADPYTYTNSPVWVDDGSPETNYTYSITTITDSNGCTNTNLGNEQVVVYKIPGTGSQNHIENTWGN